jgi:hypothetical protein
MSGGKLGSRHFRKEERECLKYKINGLESNSKNNNTSDLYRDVNESKKVTSVELTS